MTDLQDIHERLGMTPDELHEAGYVIVPAHIGVTNPDMLDRMVVASLNIIDQRGERASWYRWVPGVLHHASKEIRRAKGIASLTDIEVPA